MAETILEDYDSDIKEEFILNPLIRIFISDISFKKLVLSENVKILDLWGDDYKSLEVKLPKSIQQIVFRNFNLINIKLRELFVCNYYLYNMRIDNVELNIILNQLYMKYFNKNPKFINHYDKFMNNNINSKYHRQIIEEILEYEKQVEKGKEFCNIIGTELMETAFHPHFICPQIKKYGLFTL